jgi:hypothetical protein
MSRLFRAIATFSLCLTWLSFACYAVVGGTYHQGFGQSLNHRELVPASVQLHKPLGIDTREFDSIVQWIGVTPEPVSLALFGSSLTLAGVVLLRSTRRTQSFPRAQVARSVTDKNPLRLARYAKGVHYSRPSIPARGPFVAT